MFGLHGDTQVRNLVQIILCLHECEGLRSKEGAVRIAE